jgi:hypothetical protein
MVVSRRIAFSLGGNKSTIFLCILAFHEEVAFIPSKPFTFEAINALK